MKSRLRLIPVVLASALVGCDMPLPPPPAEPVAQAPAADTQAQEVPVAQPAEAVPHKAQVGDGAQGQKIAGHSDMQKIISGPVSALFNVKQQAAFNIQVPQALQLFQALEGRPPKSNEEFMEKIIQANRIELPVLPAGAVYRYNVEAGELWVYPEAEAPAQ